MIADRDADPWIVPIGLLAACVAAGSFWIDIRTAVFLLGAVLCCAGACVAAAFVRQPARRARRTVPACP